MASVITAASGGFASSRKRRCVTPLVLLLNRLGEERGEVGHDGPLEQLRVNRRHAVGAVRADDGEVRHADLLRLRLPR